MSQILDDLRDAREDGRARDCDEVPAPVKAPQRLNLEIWESETTRPAYWSISGEMRQSLSDSFDEYIGNCMAQPFLPAAVIREQQFSRIKELVELAYADIPVYREKYQAAGFSPDDLRNYDDIQNIPPITKAELIAAFPTRCVNPRYHIDDLFPTRSSGPSGQTLLIRVDAAAIVTDTIQGVRQMILQSGLKYQPDDLLVHVYTVPWWFSSVDGRYQTGFISNVIPPESVGRHLADMAPHILSAYPSNLETLLPYAESYRDNLYLAVTHSEYSAPAQRREWSRQLGVPVLDEYSSEEATRIAIELPDGKYHVCEDTVHLDVLDPETMRPQRRGKPGLSVITNLLNDAMPFIRYVQGDYVTEPADPAPSSMGWKQLESIDGRMNDAFLNREGRSIPAGSILDITYRWMFDTGINLAQFEILQKDVDVVEARFVPGAGVAEEKILGSLGHLEELLTLCHEHKVRVQAKVMEMFPRRPGKHRPIRREMTA